jgi:predicted RNase H-like nuclease (RuvC/YqgF family)
VALLKPLDSEDLCMGVDIESGSPKGGNARYSLVVIKCGGPLIYKAESSSLARLVRVAWDYRPRRLGVDNVYELGGDERRLSRVLSLLPPDLEVFQVTLVDGVFLDVREVAVRAGIVEDFSKMNPLRTSYVVAMLACMGYGTSVRSVEEKTVVQVSKLRSHSSGGWSQQRYQRRVRATIHSIATSIKEALDRAGLDYDYYYKESRGGLESAVFTVYAPRDVVKGVVEEVRGPDYVVKVKPVYRSKLLVATGGRGLQSRPLIVGVDPGVTTGVALVDLDGRILHVTSIRAADRGSVVELISRYGKPVIVAVDVSEVPDSVRKLATQLGANIYTPPHDLTSIEKRDLIERFAGEVKLRDSHERDALAAAYRAYLSLREKLEDVEEKLRDMGAEIEREEVKRWVLEGLSLAEALERALEKAIEDVEFREGRVRREERRVQQVDVTEYLVEIERLRAQRESLEARVRELEESLRDYERRLRDAQSTIRVEIARDAEIAKLKSRVEALEREVDRLRAEKERLEEEVVRIAKTITAVSTGELVLARRIPILTVRNLRREEEFRGGDIVIVDNTNMFENEAVAELAKMKVKAVLLQNLDSPLANILREKLIPALDARKYKVEEIHGIVLVESKVLGDAEVEKERLKALRKPPDIERIVEEYRRERRSLIERKR